METYLNLGGDSGVDGYDVGPDSITVYFNDGSAYVYTYASAGTANIETMKELARQGHGLNSFIMRRVRKAYSHRLS